MDKIKKVTIKQSLHRVGYGVKILTFFEAFRHVLRNEFNSTFGELIAFYSLLAVALLIWEERDDSVRMYPYADEEYDDEEIEDEGDEDLK